MARRILITDIHACYHTFKYLLEEKVAFKREDHLYLLGDYINKGPYSRQVLDYLMQLQESGIQLQMLRGNHEQELLDLYDGAKSFDSFLSKGGASLLKNFEIQHPRELPEIYIRFCRELDYFIELPDYLLVHAGFDFSKQNPFIESEVMLSIRDYEVNMNKTRGRPVLHGHTPTNLKKILKSLEKKNSLHYSLDAGCAYPDNPQQAHLLALDLDAWKVFSQSNIDSSDNYA